MRTETEIKERIDFLKQLIKENSEKMIREGMYINKQYYKRIDAINEYNKEISALKAVLKILPIIF